MKEMNSHPPEVDLAFEKSSESSGSRTVNKSTGQTRGAPRHCQSGALRGRERWPCGPGSVLMGSVQKRCPAGISAVASLENHFKGKASICMCVVFFWHISQASGSGPWLLNCLLHEPQSCDLQSHTVSTQGAPPRLSLHPNQCVIQGENLQEMSTSLHLVVKGRMIKCNLL